MRTILAALLFVAVGNAGELDFAAFPTPVKSVAAPAVGVPAALPFRSATQNGQFNPSHNCVRCGAYANVIASRSSGAHTHICPRCRDNAGQPFWWWHYDR